MPTPQHNALKNYRASSYDHPVNRYQPDPLTRGVTYFHPTGRVKLTPPNINPNLCLWLDGADRDDEEGEML